MAEHATSSTNSSVDEQHWLPEQVTKIAKWAAVPVLLVTALIAWELPAAGHGIHALWDHLFGHHQAAQTASQGQTQPTVGRSVTPSESATTTYTVNVELPPPGERELPPENSDKWSKAVVAPTGTHLCDSGNFSANQWHDADYPVSDDDSHWHDWPSDGSTPDANGVHYRGKGPEVTLLKFRFVLQGVDCRQPS